MSNKHKYPTISFRVSEYERNTIEARIKASGMKKKITSFAPAFITASALWAEKKLSTHL